MRIIFLDIDGVFVTRRSMTIHDSGMPFDETCVAFFNRLMSEVAAKIVISSTWRQTHPVENLRAHFRAQGFLHADSIIDATPLLNQERGREILAWIKNNNTESEAAELNYIVVDDNMYDIHPFIDRARCVQTDFEDGFQEEHLTLALAAPSFAPTRAAAQD